MQCSQPILGTLHRQDLGKEQGGMLRMGSAGLMQQGSGGNNPHSPGESAGIAAGTHLSWVREVVSDANKYIKTFPLPVWSSAC